jgi:hypothetical protein
MLPGREEHLRMRPEFEAYEASLPHRIVQGATSNSQLTARAEPYFPHPLTEGGVPEGWKVRWHSIWRRIAEPRDDSEVDPATGLGWVDYETFIVEREQGGWGMLMHSARFTERFLCGLEGQVVPTTRMWTRTAPTMWSLYAGDEHSSSTGLEGGPGMDRDIRDFIVSCYDLTDPVEEAEATLVGLGAPITVMPGSLS